MLLDGRQNELQITRGSRGRRALFQIVGTDEEHDGRRIERQDVILKPQKHPSGRVAIDAAIGDLHVGEHSGEIVPALRDRIPEEHDRTMVLRTA